MPHGKGDMISCTHFLQDYLDFAGLLFSRAIIQPAGMGHG